MFRFSSLRIMGNVGQAMKNLEFSIENYRFFGRSNVRGTWSEICGRIIFFLFQNWTISRTVCCLIACIFRSIEFTQVAASGGTRVVGGEPFLHVDQVASVGASTAPDVQSSHD